MRLEYNPRRADWVPLGSPVPTTDPPGGTVAFYRAGEEVVFEITLPKRKPVAVFMNLEDSRRFRDAAWDAMALLWGLPIEED